MLGASQPMVRFARNCSMRFVYIPDFKTTPSLQCVSHMLPPFTPHAMVWRPEFGSLTSCGSMRRSVGWEDERQLQFVDNLRPGGALTMTRVWTPKYHLLSHPVRRRRRVEGTSFTPVASPPISLLLQSITPGTCLYVRIRRVEHVSTSSIAPTSVTIPK